MYVVLDRRLREQVEGALRLEAFEAGASYDVIEHVASFFVHFNSYLGIEGFGEYPLEERRGIDEAEGPGGEDKPVHERRGVADPGLTAAKPILSPGSDGDLLKELTMTAFLNTEYRRHFSTVIYYFVIRLVGYDAYAVPNSSCLFL